MTDRGGGDARDRLDLEHLEAEPVEQLQITTTPRTEAEVRAGRDRLRADRPQVPLGERLRLEGHQLGRERRHEGRLHPGGADQLQSALERRDQIDVVAECDPRMRVERDHGRGEARVDRGADDALVTSVDPVERPDRDGPRLPLELRRRVRDPHDSAFASRVDAAAAFASRSRVARRSRSASASASVSPIRPSASSSASTTLGVGLARRRTARPPFAAARCSGRRAHRRSSARTSRS